MELIKTATNDGLVKSIILFEAIVKEMWLLVHNTANNYMNLLTKKLLNEFS